MALGMAALVALLASKAAAAATAAGAGASATGIGAGAAGAAAAGGAAAAANAAPAAIAGPVTSGATTASAAVPSGTGLSVTTAAPGVSAASGLTVPEATTSFMAGFQPGGLTTNVSTVSEAVRGTAPTFLDKLAAFGTEFGQDALRGGIVGGIQGGIRGNQNPQIGTTRGVGLGALAGGLGGGVSGGFGALANDNLGMGQALQGFSQSGTPAQSFGQQLAGGVQDLFLGEQPIQSILGSEPPGTRRGVIPNLIRRVDLNVPIGKNRRAKVRPFGRRGLTGRGLRVARRRR